MSIIGRFIANMRRTSSERRIEREIYQKIFPHINGHGDHGYPFSSLDELMKERLRGFIDARAILHDIDRAAGKMPRAEGDAFRYIVARDLNEQMRAYLKLAQEREYNPAPEDFQLAARRAY